MLSPIEERKELVQRKHFNTRNEFVGASIETLDTFFTGSRGSVLETENEVFVWKWVNYT